MVGPVPSIDAGQFSPDSFYRPAGSIRHPHREIRQWVGALGHDIPVDAYGAIKARKEYQLGEKLPAPNIENGPIV